MPPFNFSDLPLTTPGHIANHASIFDMESVKEPLNVLVNECPSVDILKFFAVSGNGASCPHLRVHLTILGFINGFRFAPGLVRKNNPNINITASRRGIIYFMWRFIF